MSFRTPNNYPFLVRLTLFLTIIISLIACAQIVPLTGGEKDTTPPKELKSTPVNGAINFSQKTITIEFDEYIKLTNVASQLIVSPLMENPPTVLAKGKKLVIKLQSELLPNTTYSLNFGNAIKDITEDNVYPNYKYVFSTGNYVDSLSFAGTVMSAFDNALKENIYVLLYDQLEDSVPLKELPRYVAITNKEGEFTITNIAQGTYKLFAINDINGNYLFDLPNEEIGFESELLTIDSVVTNHSIRLFQETNAAQFLVQSEHKTYGKIQFVFNKPTEHLEIVPLNKTFDEAKESWSIIEQNTMGDSATVWLYPNAFDKEIVLQIKDNNEIIDTVSFEIINRSNLKDTTLYLSTNISQSFDLNKNILLNIKHPFKGYEPQQIKLYEDSILVNTAFFSDVGWRNFELAYDFKEDMQYKLYLPPNSVEDIFGLKNDTFQLSFKSKKEADYGIVHLTVNPNFSKNYILQLSKKPQLVDEQYFKGKQTINYQYLQPGTYTLKLIIDANEDEKWTTGDYLKGVQPEKVYFYTKEIKVRSNWEYDINWNIQE